MNSAVLQATVDRNRLRSGIYRQNRFSDINRHQSTRAFASRLIARLRRIFP